MAGSNTGKALRRIVWLLLLLVGACNGPGSGIGPAAAPALLPVQVAAPPNYGDPLQRLHRIGAAGIPLDRPVAAGPKVALVAGDNVALTLSYLDLTRNLLANSRAPGAELDPAYMVKSTISILRRRYPRLELHRDLRSAQAGGADTTLIFDIRALAAQAGGQANSAEIDVIALDRNMRPLSRLSATARNNGTSADFLTAANVALGGLRDKSGELLR